ncbi:MAG: hypothetical protein N2111_13340 [Candidatus Sumerlaeaceae bacterium]|nr:hypothetical protein [Candidatus Sumerlaeaceae bacterium]
MTIKPESARIGEPIVLTIHVPADRMSTVSVLHEFVKEEDKDTTWALIEEREPKTALSNDGRPVWQRDYVVAAFRTGRLQPPPLQVEIDGHRRTIEVSPVTIHSVLSADETSTEPRDIKPPMALPVPPWLFVAAGAVGMLLFVAAIGALWLLLRRRMSARTSAAVPPDDWALGELNRLEQDRLIEKKRINEFYTRLSAILRTYLGRVLEMPVLDMTTSELLCLLPETPLSDEARRLTGEILDESDLVKFAKWIPEAGTCLKTLERTRRLIAITRPLLVPPSHPPGDDASARGTGPQPAPPRPAARASEIRR